MIPPPPPSAVVQPRPIPDGTVVTIEAVRRDPRAWAGKWIKVEGWINRCWSTDCVLAEKLSSRPSDQGITLSFEKQPSFDQWVNSVLPLRARVTARIDATCLVEQVCLDRAPVLREMYVEALQPNAKFPDEVK